MKVLGLIPARGGSKGIPRKNLREVAGKPLLAYAIEAAQASTVIDDVIVSTEDQEIADLARKMACRVMKRPRELAQDETPMNDVIAHVLRDFNSSHLPEFTVLLQPTAPLRTTQHIDDCVSLLREGHAQSVVSVAPVPSHHHPAWQYVLDESGELRRFDGKPLSEIVSRRQDLQQTYTRNGAIYAFASQGFLEAGTFYLPPCLAYVMPAEVSVNIDSERDLWFAERLIQGDSAL
jgi:CMP-N,N'-diacetyllegionaminic acid synthase